MRVSDGSVADNPVTGVAVTFATTLAQLDFNAGQETVIGEQGGMPVILGSSQVQVITAQNGLATLTPSAANVGPCDVYITASAGSSVVQFQLENLAAIVLPQSSAPVQIPAHQDPAQQDPARLTHAAHVLQGVPAMLVAMPQLGISNDPLADPVEAPDNAPAPEALPMDQISPEKTPSSQMAQTKEEVNAALKSKFKLSETLAKKAADGPVSKIAIQAAAPTSASKPTPVEAQPDEKRSCRRLASDSVLP
jgi:hypothetical protein